MQFATMLNPLPQLPLVLHIVLQVYTVLMVRPGIGPVVMPVLGGSAAMENAL